MKSQLSPILPGVAVNSTAKSRRASCALILGRATLLGFAVYGLVGCTNAIDTPMDIATAPKTIVPYGGLCKGMTLRVMFKNGTTRPPFGVCAVTDAYVEPCCKDPRSAYNLSCPKPEHLKFSDMASLKWDGSSTFSRCWGIARL